MRCDMGLRSLSLAVAGLIRPVLAGPRAGHSEHGLVRRRGVHVRLDPRDEREHHRRASAATPSEPDRGSKRGPSGVHAVRPARGSIEIPRPLDSPGVARFYRVADLGRYEWASAQLEALTSLLEARPDLASHMTPGADGSIDPLPFIVDDSAAQALDARARYVDTPEVAGVAYLTAFRQDVSPFTAGDFWYTFQGIELRRHLVRRGRLRHRGRHVPGEGLPATGAAADQCTTLGPVRDREHRDVERGRARCVRSASHLDRRARAVDHLRRRDAVS